jgi:hypothetical protein
MLSIRSGSIVSYGCQHGTFNFTRCEGRAVRAAHVPDPDQTKPYFLHRRLLLTHMMGLIKRSITPRTVPKASRFTAAAAFHLQEISLKDVYTSPAVVRIPAQAR